MASLPIEEMSKIPNYYVVHLPVTTEEACWGGKEIWGLPQFIGDIEYIETEECVTCSVSEGNKNIFPLRNRGSGIQIFRNGFC